MRDFFGVESPNPGVARVRCPILAFYGTKEPDIGKPEDLELLKATVKRVTNNPPRVDTLMIQNAGHMYEGEETQVADGIVKWIATLAQEKK